MLAAQATIPFYSVLAYAWSMLGNAEDVTNLDTVINLDLVTRASNALHRSFGDRLPRSHKAGIIISR